MTLVRIKTETQGASHTKIYGKPNFLENTQCNKKSVPPVLFQECMANEIFLLLFQLPKNCFSICSFPLSIQSFIQMISTY